jgi:hypothetical protein
MPDHHFRRPGAHHEPGTHWEDPPHLAPVRALAECEEFADAVCRLADGCGNRLRGTHPLRPLAAQLARSLTEAGFTLHHCVRHHPLYRLGGICLLPVSDDDGRGDPAGVVVSWTTHHLLSCDWDRWNEYRGAIGAMNEALAHVLAALGYLVRPFGAGGASLVTGRGPGRQAAGR